MTTKMTDVDYAGGGQHACHQIQHAARTAIETTKRAIASLEGEPVHRRVRESLETTLADMEALYSLAVHADEVYFKLDGGAWIEEERSEDGVALIPNGFVPLKDPTG